MEATIKKLMLKIERLKFFVERLQEMLGWQIETEKRNGNKYNVNLVVTLRFNNGVWGDILRNRRYRAVAYEMVEYALNELWDRELEDKDWEYQLKHGTDYFKTRCKILPDAKRSAFCGGDEETIRTEGRD
jgi:predicted nucleotide-binding protein (sugar kinase/HSP70/actin superfamily)